MAKRRLTGPDSGPGDTVDSPLERLVSANAQVQADTQERFAAGLDWQVERFALKAIISQLPELVYAKDTMGRFLAANDAVARDIGLERSEDLIGKTDFDLFPPDLAQGFHDIEQEIIASGTPMINMEESRIDETGASNWLRTSKLPMRDDRGEIIGLIGVARDITERKRAEQAGNAERALFRAMIDQVPDYLFAKDTGSRFIVVNRAVAADLGLQPDDLIGKTDFELHWADLARKFFADEQKVISSGEPLLDIEEYVVDVSGNKKWLSTSKVPLRNDRNEVIGIVGVSRNISERRRVEAALAESESRWNFALEGAGQGVWDHDLKHGKAFYSRMWRQMRGFGLDEVIDGSREAWLARVHPDDRARIIDQADRQNSGELAQNSFEYREQHRDGHYIWILSRGKAVEWNPDGSVARIIGTDTDITSLKEAEARASEEKEQTYRKHVAALEKAHEAAEAAQNLALSLARHDALTGLPNRRVFAEVLEAARLQAGRGGVQFAVLSLDLDRFKPVNDIYGHQAGDDVLREVATRIGAVVRVGDTVARFGGDEFALIMHCVDSNEEPGAAAALLADRIIDAVGRPIGIGDRCVDVGASIGIAICPVDGTDPETLLRAADMAMYRAKEEGRGTYRFFQRSMEDALRARMELEADVRSAVAKEEIEPHYQPLMLLAEKRLVGFEILARWHHSTRGDVEPELFIPIVEKLGLIAELTYSLLRRACLDARKWSPEITIALNVSPKHLVDPLLTAKILSILSETRFPPTRLEIEITESALVSDLPAARTILVALQELGIKISLDDFGTGYSNLYNLREIHFDKIKIDRSFVLSMETNIESAKIVHSVIDLAKSLGLPTIAEGIEHVRTLNQIVQSGGEYGQGYYFSKALPAVEATKLAEGTEAASAARKKRKPQA
jgi:diguanylate cyclase (GGDEF)-like protein/PAS domain S-box-containing protein